MTVNWAIILGHQVHVCLSIEEDAKKTATYCGNQAKNMKNNEKLRVTSPDDGIMEQESEPYLFFLFFRYGQSLKRIHIPGP